MTQPTLNISFTAGPLQLQASHGLFSVQGAAPNLTKASGGGPVTKFNPGYYPTSDTVSSAAVVASDVLVIKASGTGGNYPGSPFTGYSSLYEWGYLEPNNGPINGYGTGVGILAADFNALQSACPGARFFPQMKYAQYSTFTPANNNAPRIPSDILSSSTYGLGPTGTTNFGWALSGYNGNGTWAVSAAAIWRTAVMTRWIQFLSAMYTTPFLITAGPLSGQTLSLNDNAFCEGLIDFTEYSWDFGHNTPIPPADYTDTALTTAFNNELVQVKAALTKTQFAMMLSYGDSGPNAYINLNTLIQASANNHCSLSNADTYQNVTQINGQAFYTGSANGTGIATPPDNRGIMGYLGCAQPLDFGGGNGANPAAALTTMYNVWKNQLRCTHILPQMSDDGVHGGPSTFVPTYLTPFANSNPIPNTTRPTNLP